MAEAFEVGGGKGAESLVLRGAFWSYAIVLLMTSVVIGALLNEDRSLAFEGASTLFFVLIVGRVSWEKVELKKDCVLVRNTLWTHHIDRSAVACVTDAGHLVLKNGKTLKIDLARAAALGKRVSLPAILRDWFDGDEVWISESVERRFGLWRHALILLSVVAIGLGAGLGMAHLASEGEYYSGVRCSFSVEPTGADSITAYDSVVLVDGGTGRMSVPPYEASVLIEEPSGGGDLTIRFDIIGPDGFRIETGNFADPNAAEFSDQGGGEAVTGGGDLLIWRCETAVGRFGPEWLD